MSFHCLNHYKYNNYIISLNLTLLLTLLPQDRENRPLEDYKKSGGDPDKEFSGRVKDIEAKLRGTHNDKKPKDLMRAIG